MPLLLLSYDYSSQLEEEKEQKEIYKIHDLFDVNLGMNEDKYTHFTKDTKSEVMFVKLSSFKEDFKGKHALARFQYKFLHTLNPETLIGKQKKQDSDLSGSKRLIDIPEKKIILENDYLLSIRGSLKGYSMLENSKLLDGINLVSSNHFIHLRPRKMSLDQMYIPYLHFALDLLVEKKLNENYRQIKEMKDAEGVKQSAYNSLKVEDLKNMELSIYKDKEKQVEVYNNLMQEYEKFLEASLGLEDFKNVTAKNLGL